MCEVSYMSDANKTKVIETTSDDAWMNKWNIENLGIESLVQINYWV